METDLFGPGLDGRLSGLLRAAAEKSRNRGRPILASLTEPIQFTEPIALFGDAARTCGNRLLWLLPDSELSLIGLDTAYVVEKSGPHRFSETGAAWEELCSDALIEPRRGNIRRTPVNGRVFLR